MKLSDELVQGFAMGEAALRAAQERVTRDMMLAEDRAWIELGVKARFRELLAQHPELTRPQAYMEAVMENWAMDDSPGGYLIPPEYTVEIATRLGMPRLRDMLGWDIRVRAAIRDKPRWWQWLFHNYSTNKIASFLVWRWPKFREVVTAYDECSQAHREEKEHRVQKAYEFLREWRRKCEPAVTEATERVGLLSAKIGNLDGWQYCMMRVKDDDHQASLD